MVSLLGLACEREEWREASRSESKNKYHLGDKWLRGEENADEMWLVTMAAAEAPQWQWRAHIGAQASRAKADRRANGAMSEEAN